MNGRTCEYVSERKQVSFIEMHVQITQQLSSHLLDCDERLGKTVQLFPRQTVHDNSEFNSKTVHGIAKLYTEAVLEFTGQAEDRVAGQTSCGVAIQGSHAFHDCSSLSDLFLIPHASPLPFVSFAFL